MVESPFRRVIRRELVQSAPPRVEVVSYALAPNPVGPGARLTDRHVHKTFGPGHCANWWTSADLYAEALARIEPSRFVTTTHPVHLREEPGALRIAYYSELRAVAGMDRDVPEAVLADWYMDRSDIVLAVDPVGTFRA